MKNFLLIIALLISLQLFAGDAPSGEFDRFLADSLQATNIVDSVYSDFVLDGYLKFSQNAQGISVNNWMYDMHVGDTGVAIVWPDPNSHYRSYISFDLPEIPEGYLVDSVYVGIYQSYILGNSYEEQFPEWNVAGGDTIKCMLSHIDYGNALDVGDWDKGDLGNPYTYNHKVGVVTATPEYGYRYVDVTNCVIADYEAGRNHTQYRIAFENITTDWDGESDLVSFMTSNSAVEWDRPKLYIHSALPASIDENEITKPILQLTNYPNPFNPQTKLSYEIVESSNVTVKIFNIKGQLVETLVNEYQHKGNHTVEWNADKQSSGIYFYRLTSGNQSQTGRCLLLK